MVKFFRSRHFNLDFLILSVVLTLFNFPLFGLLKIPIHDTMLIFNTYYYFYSQWLFHHEIPQWSPFVAYGLPSHFVQIFSLSPISYITIFVGAIFQIKNVLYLFQFSILLEQLVFLTGVYLLSCLLYRNRFAVFFVSLTAGMSTVWFSQIFLNFRLFYLFPLSCFFLILFFQKKKPAFLWLTGIVSIVSLIGNTQYFAAFTLLTHAIIFMCYFLRDRKSLQTVFSSQRNNLIVFFLFIFLAAGHFLYLKQIIADVDLKAGGRVGSTGQVSLEDFLKFGGVSSAQEIFHSLILGDPVFLSSSGAGHDNTVYVGILTLIFLIWAMAHVRNFNFYVFLILGTVLVLFSRGTSVARLLYYFPLMKHFRHIGLIYGFIKIIIIICAGFGIDHLLQERRKNIFFWGKFLLLFSAAVYYAAFIGGLSTRLFFYVLACIFIFLLAFGGIMFDRWQIMPRFRMLTSPLIGSILIFIIFADLLFYQHAVGKEYHVVDQEKYNLPDIVLAAPMIFQDKRGFFPEEGRAKNAYALVSRPQRVNQSIFDFDFVQFDSCLILSRYDLMCKSVRQLESLNQGVLAVVGSCGAPKARLMTDVTTFDTEQDVFNVYNKIDLTMNALIIRDGYSKFQAIANAASIFHDKIIFLHKDVEGYPVVNQKTNYKEAGDVALKKFTANEVDFSVDVKAPGAWFLYTDAYHPGWRAFVDEKETAIKRAFLAFKSVYLGQGKHTVRFIFHSGLGSILSVLLVLVGTAAGIFLCFGFLAVFFIKHDDMGNWAFL